MLNTFFNILGGSRTTTGWRLASAGLGILSNLYTLRQQRRIDDQANQAALANYESQMAQLRVRQQQINQQAASEANEVALQAARERARLDAVAGEFGIGGNLAQRMEVENAFSSNAARTRLELNRRNQIIQTGMIGQSIRAETQSRIVGRQSLAPALLTIGGGIANALSTASPRAPRAVADTGVRPSLFSRIAENLRINRV